MSRDASCCQGNKCAAAAERSLLWRRSSTFSVRKKMMCSKGSLLVSSIVVLVFVGIGPCQARNPTSQPAKAPSREKQASPLQLSLQHPTFQPTSSPPSASPTVYSTYTSGSQSQTSDATVQRLEAFGLTMKAKGLVLPLSKNSRDVFESVARDSIRNSIVDVLGIDQIQGLEVIVTVTSSRTRKLLRGAADWDGTSVYQESISFDVLIQIQSVIEAHDMNRYVMSAFNDSMDKIIFINTLTASGDPAFVDMSTVSVTPGRIGKANGTPRTDTDTPMDENIIMGKNNTVYLIAAIISVSVAAAAIVIPAACIIQNKIQRTREQKRLKWILQNDSFQLDLKQNDDNDIASELVDFGSLVDMSTLGDLSLTSESGGKVVHNIDYESLEQISGPSSRGVIDVMTDDGSSAGEDDSMYSHASSAPILPSYENTLFSLVRESANDFRPLPLSSNDSTLLVDNDDIFGSLKNKQSPYNDTFSLTETEIYFDTRSLPLPAKISWPLTNGHDSKSVSMDRTFPSDSHSAPLLFGGETLTSLVGTEVCCDTCMVSLPTKDNTTRTVESVVESESVLDGTILHSAPLPRRHDKLLSLVGSEIHCKTSSVPAPTKKDCIWLASGSEKSCPGSLDDTESSSNAESSSSESVNEIDVQSNVVMPGFLMMCQQVEGCAHESTDNVQVYWEA